LAGDAAGNAIHQEPDLLNVPYSKVAKARKIEFVGPRIVKGVACNEFQVAYEDTVWGERMIARQQSDGSSSSEREMVKRLLDAKICVGGSDKLAYRSEQTTPEGVRVTRQLSYGEITPLPAPSARD
jgi:hypothetical protein